jgi:nicotinic acid mononucleotide adenylyltransferase
MASVSSNTKRIAVYGASFDPPTGMQGHAGIVEYCSTLFDLVICMPVYHHPFEAHKRVLTSFEHRVAMCELAFATQIATGKVIVSQCEKEAFFDLHSETNRVPGTMDVLDWLVRRGADGPLGVSTCELCFILGADTYLDLVAGKWKRSADMLREVRLFVVMRSGVVVDGASQVPGLGPISSTLARATVDFNQLEQICGHDVAMYIRENRLYGFAHSPHNNNNNNPL